MKRVSSAPDLSSIANEVCPHCGSRSKLGRLPVSYRKSGVRRQTASEDWAKNVTDDSRSVSQSQTDVTFVNDEKDKGKDKEKEKEKQDRDPGHYPFLNQSHYQDGAVDNLDLHQGSSEEGLDEAQQKEKAKNHSSSFDMASSVSYVPRLFDLAKDALVGTLYSQTLFQALKPLSQKSGSGCFGDVSNPLWNLVRGKLSLENEDLVVETARQYRDTITNFLLAAFRAKASSAYSKIWGDHGESKSRLATIIFAEASQFLSRCSKWEAVLLMEACENFKDKYGNYIPSLLRLEKALESNTVEELTGKLYDLSSREVAAFMFGMMNILCEAIDRGGLNLTQIEISCERFSVADLRRQRDTLHQKRTLNSDESSDEVTRVLYKVERNLVTRTLNSLEECRTSSIDEAKLNRLTLEFIDALTFALADGVPFSATEFDEIVSMLMLIDQSYLKNLTNVGLRSLIRHIDSSLEEYDGLESGEKENRNRPEVTKVDTTRKRPRNGEPFHREAVEFPSGINETMRSGVLIKQRRQLMEILFEPERQRFGCRLDQWVAECQEAITTFKDTQRWLPWIANFTEKQFNQRFIRQIAPLIARHKEISIHLRLHDDLPNHVDLEKDFNDANGIMRELFRINRDSIIYLRDEIRTVRTDKLVMLKELFQYLKMDKEVGIFEHLLESRAKELVRAKRDLAKSEQALKQGVNLG